MDGAIPNCLNLAGTDKFMILLASESHAFVMRLDSPFSKPDGELAIMTQLRHLFSEHPASVGESYPTHLLAASAFALRLLAGGLAF